jgi:hypothetical protein
VRGLFLFFIVTAMKFSSSVEFEKYTTAARDARVVAGKMPVGSVIENTTTGTVQWRQTASKWLDIGLAPSVGSFTPLAYVTPPATNSDADQQTYILALQAQMITKGIMLPPPFYTISGQITGSVQSGITLELRENVSNILVGTVTTDAGGNYAFTPVPSGTYKVLPAISGHIFTPGTRSVTVSGGDVTAQNFSATLALSSQNTSPSFVFVPQNIFGVASVRAVQKSPLTLNANTFPAVTSNAYMPIFQGARWFLPLNDGRVLVYDETWTLRATINPAVGAVFRVHFSGGKYCCIGTGGIRFGTYNQATDEWTSGTLLSNEVYPSDNALSSGGNIYIVSSFGGSPNRNVTVLSMSSETVIDRRTVFSGATLIRIAFGDGAIFVINNSGVGQVIDINTWTQRGSNCNGIGADNAAIAYSSGKFWVTRQLDNNVFMVNSTTAALSVAPFSGLFSVPSGCISDDNFIYVADQASNTLRVLNASDGILNGSVTGIVSPIFRKS